MFKGSSQNVEKNCNFVGDNALIVRKPKFFFLKFLLTFRVDFRAQILHFSTTSYSFFHIFAHSGGGGRNDVVD